MNLNNKPAFFKIFKPRYDEVTLFIMSFSFMLLLLANISEFIPSHVTLRTNNADELRLVFLAILFVAGLVLSFYHAFSKRAKSSCEKYLMLLFAVLVNGISGILAGSYALQQSSGFFIIFPILNIASGFILLGLFRDRIINTSNIDDDNAPLREVCVSGTIVGILFVLCNYILSFHPIQTFSICVAYASNGHKPIHTLIFGKRVGRLEA